MSLPSIPVPTLPILRNVRGQPLSWEPISFALRRPMTVVIALVAIVLGCVLAVGQMAVDIFPSLNLPVIYVCQPYGGMDPAQMEGFLANYYEYHFLYITGIHHVESRNIQGLSLMKLYLSSGHQHGPGDGGDDQLRESGPGLHAARHGVAVRDAIRHGQRAGRLPGASPARRGASAEIQDLALFRVRPMFASLPGVSAPPPFGGNQRTVVITVDPERLRAYGMSPDEVVSALAQSNAISPSGNIPVGDKYPIVPVNSVVRDVRELETMPLRTGPIAPVYFATSGASQDCDGRADGLRPGQRPAVGVYRW